MPIAFIDLKLQVDKNIEKKIAKLNNQLFISKIRFFKSQNDHILSTKN